MTTTGTTLSGHPQKWYTFIERLGRCCLLFISIFGLHSMSNNLFLAIADQQAEGLQGGNGSNGGFSFFVKSSYKGFMAGLRTSTFSFFTKFSFGGKNGYLT